MQGPPGFWSLQAASCGAHTKADDNAKALYVSSEYVSLCFQDASPMTTSDCVEAVSIMNREHSVDWCCCDALAYAMLG